MKKDTASQNYITPFIYFRTPSLTLSTVADINANDDLVSFINSNKERAAFIEKALYLASPALYELFDHISHGKQISIAPSALDAIRKYIIRMSTRCTPFGLMSGCLIGKISDSTYTTFKPDLKKSFIKLDLLALTYLYEHILGQPEVRKLLKFRINNSMIPISSNWRYSEYIDNKSVRKFQISEIEKTDHVDLIIQLAANYCSYSELSTSLQGNLFIDSSVAEEFLNELIDNKILISDLEPSVVGPYYGDILFERLNMLKIQNENVSSSLSKIWSQLSFIQTNKYSSSVLDYIKLNDLITSFLPDTQRNDKTNGYSFVFANTYFVNSNISLSQSTVQHWLRQIHDLEFLKRTHGDPLAKFREKFVERYQQQEVPLLEALDIENGIGVAIDGAYRPTELISSVFSLKPNRKLATDDLDWLRGEVINYSVANQTPFVDLNVLDISDLKTKNSSLPGSWYIHGSILGQTGLFLRNCGGPSMVNLVGRFCLDDEKLDGEVKKLIKLEEERHPNIIYAEISHLPEPRAGNVLARPDLRRYTISYITPSLNESQEIPINDLWLSVVDNKLVLRSRKLNKQVIPRLSSAHNFSAGDDVYRFLGSLQYEYEGFAIEWHWGLFGKGTFLPRVYYQDLILSRAIWHLNSESSFADQLDNHRRVNFMPEKVCLHQDNNDFYIDLQSSFGLRFLEKEWKKHKGITLTEWLFEPDTCMLKDEKGNAFVNEIIIPVLGPPINYPNTKLLFSDQNNIQANFPPGSEWIYLKLYTGPKTIDKLLISVIGPLIDALVQKGVIDNWFFIRYNDPDYHLRLRVHIPPVHFDQKLALCNHIINSTFIPYFTSGEIHKMQYDTYQREIDRYGCKTIDSCEGLFSLDSDCCLQILSLDLNEIDLIYSAVKICLFYMDIFSLNSSTKLIMSEAFQKKFLLEQLDPDTVKMHLNILFRHHHKSLQHFISCRNIPLPDVKRSREYADFILQNYTYNSNSFISIFSGIIHMSINRLFSQNQRQYEMIIYHFLCRFMLSDMARK